MLKIIRSVIAPIISLIILVMGNALFVTYTSVRLKIDGYSVNTIGYVVGAYFAGLLLGSYYCNRLIERIGHIRAYAVFASILTTLAMIQALFLEIWMWALIRFLGGLIVAGLFITIESWLLAKSTTSTKGKVLSIYMASFYISQGVGQLLLNVADPMTFIPFAIVVLLTAISIVPVSITKITAPVIQEQSALNIFKLVKKCPIGVYTCVISGLILGPIYGLIPVYIKDIGMDIEKVAYATSFTILGGFLLQWPIGHLSDKLDRRKIIATIGLLTTFLSIVILSAHTSSELLIYTFLALFGGLTFTIYPLGISHGSDMVESKDLIAATASLSLAYSLGAIIGPIVASYAMKFFGPNGLFVYSAVAAIGLFILSMVRVYQKPPIPLEEKVQYRNVPRQTPFTPELDPRTREKEEIEQKNLSK